MSNAHLVSVTCYMLNVKRLSHFSLSSVVELKTRKKLGVQ